MDCFPVWVVSPPDGEAFDNVFPGIAAIFPATRLDLAVILAQAIGGKVHPGAMGTEVNFAQRVNIAGDAPSAGSS